MNGSWTPKKVLSVMLSAVIFLISFTVYVASAFVAGTAVFSSVIPWFNDHQHLAMIVFAVLILIYTFLGGYKAVCWTDFFQGLMMLVALLAVPIVMKATGDYNSALYGAYKEGVSAFGTDPFAAPWQEIVTGLGWGLGYFGMPHILVRFMSIEKPSMIKKSASVAIIWVILTLGAAILIAYFGRTFVFSDGRALTDILLPFDQKRIFIEIVSEIFPGFIAGILLSAIIAASMSTADSQLLVASSAFTSDIYKPLIRKDKANDKEMLWIGRVVVFVVAVVAFIIARRGLDDETSWAADIMNMVENAWGLFGASFGPVVILSLFWKRFNYAGAVAGIIAGAIGDIGWLLLCTGTIREAVITDTGVYEIVPGFICGLIVAVIATLLTKKPGKEVEAIYDRATDKSLDD